MIDPTATGTVKRPSADLRRSAAAGKLFRPTLPPRLTTRLGGASNNRPGTHQGPRCPCAINRFDVRVAENRATRIKPPRW